MSLAINFNFSIFSSLVIFSERSFEALLTVDCTKTSGSIELVTLTLIKLKNIIEIVKIFLSEFNSNNFNTKIFSDEVFNFIKNLNHLKNFSQLKKFVEWIAIMMEEKNEEIITIDMMEDLIKTCLNHVDKTLVSNELMDFQLKTARENFERDYLIHNLQKYNFNISKMSSKIGMERTALYRKLKLMKIKTDLKE